MSTALHARCAQSWCACARGLHFDTHTSLTHFTLSFGDCIERVFFARCKRNVLLHMRTRALCVSLLVPMQCLRREKARV